MDINLFSRLEPLITNGMSTFQMEYFVVNESITTYKKLKQAMVEAKGRLEVLANGEFDLEENMIKRERALLESEQCQGFELQLKNIEIKRLDYIINRTTAMRQQQTLEVEFFMSVIEKLVIEMGGIDCVRESLSDPEYMYQQESDYWTKKLGRSVFADFVNYGTISKGLSESITCLPTSQQAEIYKLAIDQQNQLTQLLTNTRDTLLVEQD